MIYVSSGCLGNTQFSQYRAVLFSRQTAKDRLLKEPLCSYSVVTLTFKFAKQAHRKMRVSHGPCKLCVYDYFPFMRGVYLERKKMWHFREV